MGQLARKLNHRIQPLRLYLLADPLQEETSVLGIKLIDLLQQQMTLKSLLQGEVILIIIFIWLVLSFIKIMMNDRNQ